MVLLIKKVLVFIIIFLFFRDGVVSSTNNSLTETPVNYPDNFLKEIPVDCFQLESLYSSEEKISSNSTWYMFIAYGSVGTGFYASYPNGTYKFSEWEGDAFFSGGTWTNDGRYLCCMYENGTLYDIDLETFDACAIGDGGVSLNGLSYNPVTCKLYGASGKDLFEIDMTTGVQTHVGAFGIDNYSDMIAIAFDMDGICYGWDVKFSGDSYLYKINTGTGEATIVSGMGMNLLYAQDGAFEYDSDMLWLTAYSTTGFLAYWDWDAEELVIVSILNSEVTALAITYEGDTTPPVSTHSLDPPEPDGENGWYVNDVNVTLSATDNKVGVKEIKYQVNGGPVETIPGSTGNFYITDNGKDVLVEYWAIDNAGNTENKNTFTIDIDQTAPTIELIYEIIGGNPLQGWEFLITVMAIDDISGMERVEIYINDELFDILYEPGPSYEWIFITHGSQPVKIKVVGFDLAGNSDYDEIIVRKVIKSSIYPLFLLLIERSPLLQGLLDILGWNG